MGAKKIQLIEKGRWLINWKVPIDIEEASFFFLHEYLMF
jgi:hypothetical protein